MKSLVTACFVLTAASLALATACSSNGVDETTSASEAAIANCPSPNAQAAKGDLANPLCPGGPVDPPDPPDLPPKTPPRPIDARPAWARNDCSLDTIGNVPVPPKPAVETYLVRPKPGITSCPDIGISPATCTSRFCLRQTIWDGSPLFPEYPAAGCRYTKTLARAYTAAEWALLSDRAGVGSDPDDCSSNIAPPPMVYRQCYAQTEPQSIPEATAFNATNLDILQKYTPTNASGAPIACKRLGMTTCQKCGMDMTNDDDAGTGGGDPDASAPQNPEKRTTPQAIYLVLDNETAARGDNVYVGVPSNSAPKWVTFRRDGKKFHQYIKIESAVPPFAPGNSLWVGTL